MAPEGDFEVHLARTATRDLEGIAEYIASQDSEHAAARAIRKIRSAIFTLRTLPHRGRVVPELREHGKTESRQLVCPPWRIIFQVKGRRVSVLAVLDSRRNLNDILRDRFVK